MKKPPVHFAHANSFPAGTYRKLFSYLSDKFEVGFLERHAHNPHFPVDDGWTYLKEELRREIEIRYAEKIIGIGHSLGGILHFLLAVERPDLYRRIILLDAPLVGRLSGAALKLLKKTGLIVRLPVSRRTHFRRNSWKSKDEAFEHFRKKEKFKAFDEEVLRDYIEAGTIETEDGRRKLLFEPEIEAKIYQTLPHDFAKYRGRLEIPASYIGGDDSREARLAGLDFMKKNFTFDFHFLEGSHLFPFEKPAETACLIKSLVNFNTL